MQVARISLVMTLVLGGPLAVLSDEYAVLVAGSNGIWNYRHQADVWHSAQVLLRNGMPRQNMIVMAYDDIATHTDNPFKGKLYNKPSKSGADGIDVYTGVQADYTKDTVTPQNFLKVLLGDNSAGGKVLNTTSTDRIFVFFTDHGAPGVVAFPSSDLYANDLITTLREMHDKRKYKELVFYLEACESGSMFDKILPSDINVYATTASNPHESSWATYCPPNDDIVNGVHINTCLGDLYSINWMENTETVGTKQQLITQYFAVKNLTDRSEVNQYGDTTISQEEVGAFQWPRTDAEGIDAPRSHLTSVDSRDVPLVSEFYRYLRAPAGSRSAYAASLIKEIERREEADTMFLKIQNIVTKGNGPVNEATTVNFECIKMVNAVVEQECGRYTDYSRKYMRNFVNLCGSPSYTTADIIGAVQLTCQK